MKIMKVPSIHNKTGDGFGGKNFRHSKNVLHPNPKIKKGLDLN